MILYIILYIISYIIPYIISYIISYMSIPFFDFKEFVSKSLLILLSFLQPQIIYFVMFVALLTQKPKYFFFGWANCLPVGNLSPRTLPRGRCPQMPFKSSIAQIPLVLCSF